MKIKRKILSNLFNENYGLKLGEFNKTAGTERVKLDFVNTVLLLKPPDDLEELAKCYDDTLKRLIDKHTPLITKVRTVRTSWVLCKTTCKCNWSQI